jgi:hypothetical protein
LLHRRNFFFSLFWDISCLCYLLHSRFFIWIFCRIWE